MQLLTLTDAHHNAYKGVLVPDPMRPCTCFEIFSKTTVKKSKVKMPAEKQIFQEQADDSLKFCKAKRLDDDKFNKLLLTKTQTCPSTLESLFEKSDAVRMQKGLPLEPRMAGMASRLGNPWAAAAFVTEPAATRQVGAQMQTKMRATMRAAAWTMEPMAATLRRSLLVRLGRC